MPIVIRVCLILILFLTPTAPGHAAELTQRQWMVSLVDALGWSYGLPDEPQDPDYINILTGNRSFRFEAEEVYAPDEDNVSFMSFRNFGPFSGRGWLNGTREPSQVHLRFILPIAGRYELVARLRQPGHQFRVGGVVKEIDAETMFAEVSVGEFALSAGRQEIVVTLPPGGSIDYITLTASNLAVITPADGWQPDEPLTWEVIQSTLLQLFHLADLFPSTPMAAFEAEDLPQEEVQVVSIPHLGQPSGGKWLRAGPLPVQVSFPLKLTESGFYDLTLRVMGHPIDIAVGDYREIRLEAKDYLDDYPFKGLFLFAGHSDIVLKIPPGGGVDQMTLSRRQVEPALANSLLGFAKTAAPETRDIDKITKLLAAFGVER